jgi:hypothetical protein
MDDDIELMDLTNEPAEPRHSMSSLDELKRLEVLDSATKNTPIPSVSCLMRQNQSPSVSRLAHSLAFLPAYPPTTGEQSPNHEGDVSEFKLPDNALHQQSRFAQDTALVTELTRYVPPLWRTAPHTSTTYNCGDSDSDSLLDEAVIGLADVDALGQGLLDIAPDKEGLHADKSFEVAETSTTLQPDSSHTKSYQPVISHRSSTTGTTAPSFESSCTPLVSSEDSRSQKNKRRCPYTDTDVEEQPDEKRHPSGGALEVKTGDKKEAYKPIESAEMSSSQPTEIDPVMLQMFGSYVDFV